MPAGGGDLCTHLCRAVRLPRGMRSSHAAAMSAACSSMTWVLPQAGRGASGRWGWGGGLGGRGGLGAVPGAPVSDEGKAWEMEILYKIKDLQIGRLVDD